MLEVEEEEGGRADEDDGGRLSRDEGSGEAVAGVVDGVSLAALRDKAPSRTADEDEDEEAGLRGDERPSRLARPASTPLPLACQLVASAHSGATDSASRSSSKPISFQLEAVERRFGVGGF